MKTFTTSTSSIRPVRFHPVAAVGLTALLLLAVGGIPAAHAASQRRIYVASSGLDTNTGSLTKPKLTFAGALADLAPGGEIIALDSANYGGATITHPTTITAEPGVAAYVIVGGNNSGLTIAAGSQDTITLRGLIFEGGGASGTGGSGVNVTSAGTVRVENCQFTTFANGINMNPSSSANIIVDGGNASVVYTGIQVMSNSASVTATATISNFEVDSATTGIYAFAPVTNSSVYMTVNRCTVANNVSGLGATGAGATMFVGDCTINSNSTSVSASASASIYTFGNNRVTGGPAPEFTATGQLQ